MFQDVYEYISKNENVERNFAEVKRAYRGGVYKACTLTLWTCVVLDIIEKSKSLSEINSKAKNKIKEIELIKENLASSKDDLKRQRIFKMQELENSILKYARDDLGILSSRGYTELERIKADRNECAHPSFVGDDYFVMSGALVRSHIESAWVHLISMDPLTGDYLIEQLESKLDPKSTKIWKKESTFGDLINGRSVDVWNGKTRDSVLTMLLGKALLGSESPDYKIRIFDVLEFIYLEKPMVIVEAIRKNIDKYRGRREYEEIVLKCAQTFGHWDMFWADCLDAGQKEIILDIFSRYEEEDFREYILNNNFGLVCFSDAAPEVCRNAFWDIIQSLDEDEFIKFAPSFVVSEILKDRFRELVSECSSYASGYELIGKGVDVINNFSTKDFSDFIKVFLQNDQMTDSYQTPSSANLIYENSSPIIQKLMIRLKEKIDFSEYSGYADFDELNF